MVLESTTNENVRS